MSTKRDRMTLNGHPSKMKDIKEKLSAKCCLYMAELPPAQDGDRRKIASENLGLPPFKYQEKQRTEGDVDMRLNMDLHEANAIMTEGLPDDQKQILQEHADPYFRLKALENFFYTKGDRKTISQFKKKLHDRLHDDKKQGRGLDPWLATIFAAASLCRDVQKTPNLTDRDLVGMVTEALLSVHYKVENRLELMLSDDNKDITWSETRAILIAAERDIAGGTNTSSESEDDEPKSKPSAQATEHKHSAKATESDSMAEVIKAAMVSGFQQMSAAGGEGGGWRGGGGWGGGKGGGGRGGGGGGWRGGRGRGGGKGGGRKCFVCGVESHLARDCPEGFAAKQGNGF
jgi:hypothetical protein